MLTKKNQVIKIIDSNLELTPNHVEEGPFEDDKKITDANEKTSQKSGSEIFVTESYSQSQSESTSPISPIGKGGDVGAGQGNNLLDSEETKGEASSPQIKSMTQNITG